MPLTADEVIQLATTDDPDPAAIQALIDGALAEHSETERARVDAKNRELLTELATLKPYKALGKTPDEIQAEIAAAEESRRKIEALEAGVDHDKLDELAKKRAQELNDQFKQTIADAREADRVRAEKAEETAVELNTKLDDERARRMMNLSARGIIDGLEDDVYRRLRPCLVRDEETGAMVLRNPKTGATLQGENGDMTMEELFDGLRSSTGNESWNSKGTGYFKAEGAGGGEGSGHKFNRRGAPNKKRSEMTVAEKNAFITKYTEERYKQLPA